MKFVFGVSVALASILASGQAPQVPAASQQVAAAVLPLPPAMRQQATVVGYTAEMALVTLRQGSNGMVCTTSRPGAQQFDVRCYHETFMPLIRRIRKLYAKGTKQEEVSRTIDSEVADKRLNLPDHPTAGYRMLGPISGYNAATNATSNEIKSWQSIHFPYKTAVEIRLPEEGQVARTHPYVMSSGTFWSHAMIEHEIEHEDDRRVK